MPALLTDTAIMSKTHKLLPTSANSFSSICRYKGWAIWNGRSVPPSLPSLTTGYAATI